MLEEAGAADGPFDAAILMAVAPSSYPSTMTTELSSSAVQERIRAVWEALGQSPTLLVPGGCLIFDSTVTNNVVDSNDAEAVIPPTTRLLGPLDLDDCRADKHG